MPPHDPLGTNLSAVRHERALKHFTNRHSFRRRFGEYLNRELPLPTIYFLHGDGGNGKSLLLKFLRQNCFEGYRPDWHKPPNGARPIPFAYLNFEEPPVGDNRPQDPFYGLHIIRRQLSKFGLRFPLYDYASIHYLKETGQLTRSRLENLYSPEDLECCATFLSLFENPDATTTLATIVTEAATFAPLLGAAVNALQPRFLPRMTLYIRERRLEPAQVADIGTWDPNSTLLAELPRLLAEDLNNAMRPADAPSRIVLFLDSHDRFWSQAERIAAVGGAYHERDQWLRCLLGNLRPDWGIVALVSGREPPKWHTAPRETRIKPDRVELRSVDNLPRSDAEQYLTAENVTDPHMRQAILAYTEVREDQHHPLFLGMCVDVLRSAGPDSNLTPAVFPERVREEEKADELTDRILHHAGTAVRAAVVALCACRSFDWDIYVTLGSARPGQRPLFTPTPETFDTLIEFSFVWREQRGGQTRHRIHDLIRRLNRDRAESKLSEADAVLEAYHRTRAEAGDESAVAEVIYHANQGEPTRGINEWLNTFDDALMSSRFSLCELLDSLRSDLLLPTDFHRGRIAYDLGKYRSVRTRFDSARDEYHACTGYIRHPTHSRCRMTRLTSTASCLNK